MGFIFFGVNMTPKQKNGNLYKGGLKNGEISQKLEIS